MEPGKDKAIAGGGSDSPHSWRGRFHWIKRILTRGIIFRKPGFILIDRVRSAPDRAMGT